MTEPAGMFAVVERNYNGHILHLVKAPLDGRVYWWPIGSDDGYSWAQVTRWDGTLTLVSPGVAS